MTTSTTAPTAPLGTPSRSRSRGRTAGLLLLAGVVLYALPSALHGNPPIDDAAATLEYVAGTTGWRLAHLVNILAVALWVIATAMISTLPSMPAALGRASVAVWSMAGGAFAVYLGIHAIGLVTASEQYLAVGADTAAVVERTEALLLVLGSAAFVAQGLIGLSVSLTGLMLAGAGSRVLGALGVTIGLGWLLGAVMIDFAIIVPFTALTWLWMVALGVRLLLGRLPMQTAS